MEIKVMTGGWLPVFKVSCVVNNQPLCHLCKPTGRVRVIKTLNGWSMI
jgi:hypothetical protein